MSRHQVSSGSGNGSNGAHAYGWAETQGVRPTMEDAMILGVPLTGELHLWAVLDGHAGRRSAERLVEWLPQALIDACPDGQMDENAIIIACELVDERLLAEQRADGFDDGATALLVITDGGAQADRMLVAQVGDSQAVLCGKFGADALCPQHRTDNPAEEARLASEGARVEDGRVCGASRAVAVTRSFGDVDVKPPNGALTVLPDVVEQDLTPADELLILGCDGLWDVMSAEDAWELAKRKAKTRDGKWDLPKAARALVDAALELKTGDNVSVLVLGLRKPKSAPPLPPPSQPAGDMSTSTAEAEAAEQTPAKAAVLTACPPASGPPAEPVPPALVESEDEYVSRVEPAVCEALGRAFDATVAQRSSDPLRAMAEFLAPPSAEVERLRQENAELRRRLARVGESGMAADVGAAVDAGSPPTPSHGGSSRNLVKMGTFRKRNE
jgi:serine/threonine protein phosphatase PrpC